MAVKPIENSNRRIIIRLAIVSLLIVTALIINKFRLSRLESKEEVLGTEVKTQIEEAKDKGNDLVADVREEAQKTFDNAATVTEDTMNEVFGQATDLIMKEASKSAQQLKDFVFDNTVGNLLKQIDKLPDEQKEDVKRNVCQ